MSSEKERERLKELEKLFKHHIESFDYLVDAGLETLLLNIRPVVICDPATNKKLRIFFGKPDLHVPLKEQASKKRKLLPYECRQAKTSYTGKLTVEVCIQYDGGAPIREKIHFGKFPIMLKSKLCHLNGVDPNKLVSYREEATEMGGYFLLNGLERVVRLLILPKRNVPMSVVRDTFRERREGHTDKAVVMRCVREDQSAVTVKLYYLENGSARIGFWIQGGEYLLPVGVVLKI